MSENEVFYLEKSGLIESVKKLLLGDDFKTICIDGAWGSGKTYFCKKLQNALSQEHNEPHVIYCNCSKSDYAASPILLLLSAVHEYFYDHHGVGCICGDIGKFIPQIITVGNKTSKRIEDFVLKHGYEFYRLKTSLKRVAENRKIIIVLDEIDRCYPEYILNIFKIVRDIFDANGIKIVYSANVEVLKEAIACQFGAVDIEIFLRKYIDIFVPLPVRLNTDKEYDVPRAFLHFQNKLKNVGDGAPLKTILFSETLGEFSYKLVCAATKEIIKYWNLSMRDVELLVKCLKQPYAFNDIYEPYVVPAMFFGVVLSLFRRKEIVLYLNTDYHERDLCRLLLELFDVNDNNFAINKYIEQINSAKAKTDSYSVYIAAFEEVAKNILYYKY